MGMLSGWFDRKREETPEPPAVPSAPPTKDEVFTFHMALKNLDAEKVEGLLTRFPALCHEIPMVKNGYEKVPILRYVRKRASKSMADLWSTPPESAYRITRALLNAGARLEDNRGSRHEINNITYNGESILQTAACKGIGPMVRAIVEHSPQAALEKDAINGGTPLQHLVDAIVSPHTVHKDHPRLFTALLPLAEVSELNTEENFVNCRQKQVGERMLIRLYNARHTNNYKSYHPVDEAFTALTDAGMDVDIPNREGKTLLQKALENAHILQTTTSSSPRREIQINNSIDDIKLLLLCGADQGVESRYDGQNCHDWIKAQPENNTAAIAYIAVQENLARECADILSQKKDAGKLLLRARPGSTAHLTNLARALAEFDMLDLLFTETCATLHGGTVQMAKNAACIEALLPERLHDRIHLARTLREHELAKPDDTALVQYAHGVKHEMSVA